MTEVSTQDLVVDVSESPPLAVVVEEQGSPAVELTILPEPSVVTVEVPGPRGPEGPPGTDTHYVHPQDTASDRWEIAHNLGKRPSVMVVDSAGTVVIGTVQHVGNNNLVISFGSPFAGEAILN